MGGHQQVSVQPSTLRLVVEWQSSPEFGPVDQIDLYLGVSTDAVGKAGARTYAPQAHGVRGADDPQGVPLRFVTTTEGGVSKAVTEMQDGYFLDPSGALRYTIPESALASTGYSGVKVVTLDLTMFPASLYALKGQRFYVRAFARTRPMTLLVLPVTTTTLVPRPLTASEVTSSCEGPASMRPAIFGGKAGASVATRTRIQSGPTTSGSEFPRCALKCGLLARFAHLAAPPPVQSLHGQSTPRPQLHTAH